MSDQQTAFDFAPVAALLKASDFRPPQCCERPAVSSLDHTVFHADRTTEERVNRICLVCRTHWYGPPEAVKQYTRAEWDELMESALREDVKAAKADCPACYWDRVPARAFRLCGHPTLTDDETIRSQLHECPGFRPYDNSGKPLASQNQPL